MRSSSIQCFVSIWTFLLLVLPLQSQESNLLVNARKAVEDAFEERHSPVQSAELITHRYADWTSAKADLHGKNDAERIAWDPDLEAVRLHFPAGKGSLEPQLRHKFDDRKADIVFFSIEARWSENWAKTRMPVHKSFQLAVDKVKGLPFQRYTTRNRYGATGSSSISHIDVRDCIRTGPGAKIGPGDTLLGSTATPLINHGEWIKFVWIVDYASPPSFTLRVNDEYAYRQSPVPGLSHRINSFWVEFNSSLAKRHDVDSVIWIKELQIVGLTN